MRSRTTLLLLALFAVAAPTTAQQPDVEVQHSEIKQPKRPTLRFLRENRDFLRGQLDRLRQRVREQNGDAEELSARDLLLRGLLEGIVASEDSLSREQARLAQRDFLESVSELGELEAQLDRLEAQLGLQRERMLALERDYVDRQQTALMVILEGLPSDRTPSGIVISENGDRRWHVTLGPEQQRALREGGAAQLLHEFVEPRPMELTLVAEGEGFADWAPWTLHVQPERDRLTLLLVDFSSPERGRELPTETWQR